MLPVVAGLAEMERATMIERIRAGMDRAKREGKHVGRRRAEDNRAFLRKAAPVLDAVRDGALSQTQACRQLGCGHQTLKRLLRAEPQARGRPSDE